MTQAFVTIAIPFEAGDGAIERVNQALDGMGNPAIGDIRAKMRGQIIHFISITVVEGRPRAHLVIELVCDNSAGAGIETIAGCLGEEINRLLPIAGVAKPQSLTEFLRRHSINTGSGL